MSLHHIANHLASKGRNGDTTLVHMTKGEVAGLQALAKANGTSLTKNPDTGLPEAFSLKSLVPMAAGAGLMAMGVPAPIAAGLVGAGAWASSGSLTQGLMAGLGAYGGAGLATPATTTAIAPQTQLAGTELGSMNASGQFAPPSYSVNPDVATAPQAMPTGQIDARAAYDPTFQSPSYSGSTEASLKPWGATDQVWSNLKENPKLGMYAAAPIIGDAMTPKQYGVPEVKSDSDMGQRYQFNSGYDNSVPGRTGPASYSAISNEEAKKLYGFAEGGSVQYPVGEPVMRMAEGGKADAAPSDSRGGGWAGNAVGMGGKAVRDLVSDLQAQGVRLGTPPHLLNRADEQQASQPSVTGYGSYTPEDAYVAARGLGLGIDYSGYDTAPNQGIAAMVNRGNPNQNIVDLYKAAEAKKAAEEAKSAEEKRIANESAASSFSDVGYQLASGGGISTLGGYSDGGRLLKGPGDGMSDNIPAKIGQKQPARLADGEFVVPADVVSHLGNGSTDAGAKHLYKMMDKVRSARTGRKAQGKQINPNKFVPA